MEPVARNGLLAGWLASSLYLAHRRACCGSRMERARWLVAISRPRGASERASERPADSAQPATPLTHCGRALRPLSPSIRLDKARRPSRRQRADERAAKNSCSDSWAGCEAARAPSTSACPRARSLARLPNSARVGNLNLNLKAGGNS